MKTPVRYHFKNHDISDHSERKCNDGECDDRITLQATLGQDVYTREVGEYLFCANGPIKLEYKPTDMRGIYLPLT